jgi:nucleoside-diphosphate-sugar epimerase
MDLTRISSELGYKPQIGVEKGLAEYVEWLKSHPL